MGRIRPYLPDAVNAAPVRVRALWYVDVGMSFLPQSASFEERVSDYFLAFRGSGLSLSPLDVELLSSWASSGAPFEVVARGIRRAAERAEWDRRPDEPTLRSLRACRREVDVELRRHAKLDAGRGENLIQQAPRRERNRELKKAQGLLEGLALRRPAVWQAASALLQTAERLDPALILSLSDREDRMVACLLRALPFEERLALLRNARDLVKAASPLSAWARRQSTRFHRSTLLRRHLGV